MIHIRTLEKTPVAAIVQAFNEAFADYMVPLQVTEASLLARIKSEHIQLDRSVGAFEEERLVGFILLATGRIYGRPTLYNGGTGVVPGYRGRKITAQLYAFIRGHIETDEQHLLEVITSNEKAVRAYSAIGMSAKRTFNCFKGNCIATPAEGLTVKKAIVFPTFDTYDFWNFEPSWQNSTAAINRALHDHTIFIITNGGRLLGYIVFNTAAGRLKQLAVRKDQRRQGIGTTLLAAMNKALRGKEITAINADSSDEGITAFFQANGLKLFVKQYEMMMP